MQRCRFHRLWAIFLGLSWSTFRFDWTTIWAQSCHCRLPFFQFHVWLIGVDFLWGLSLREYLLWSLNTSQILIFKIPSFTGYSILPQSWQAWRLFSTLRYSIYNISATQFRRNLSIIGLKSILLCIKISISLFYRFSNPFLLLLRLKK